MKVLEDKAGKAFPKTPLKITCPHCKSVLLIEAGDYRKKYVWVYTMDRGRQRCYCYVVDCPCCEEEFKLGEYENI